MFKSNDIVICIDKTLKQCTYGKKYKIFTIERMNVSDVIYIFNDNYKLREYFEYSFISLKEYRKQKLQKLNDE